MEKNLIEKGILSKDGHIDKNKINLITGAMTQSFTEMVWASVGGDMETINRFTDILVKMNTDKERQNLFRFIQMCYGLMGVKFPDEATGIINNAEALEYYIFSFTADFGELIQEHIMNHSQVSRHKKAQFL